MDSALKSRQITIKIVPLVPFRLRRNATAKSMKITFFSLNFLHFSRNAVVKGLTRYFEQKLFPPKWTKRHPYHTQVSKQLKKCKNIFQDMFSNPLWTPSRFSGFLP